MVKFSRLVGLVLIVVMLAATLGACGNNAGTDPTPTPSSVAVDNPTDSPAPTETPKPKATKITVSVFDRSTAGQTPPTDNYWTDWIKEKALEDINVEVEFVSIPRSEEINRLQVLMASNTAPDICVTYDYNVVLNYYRDNGIMKLDAILEKFPDLKAFLGEGVLAGGNFYGELAAIPARRMMIAKFATWIRKDWLDALGMPLPTTTDEYYNALVAFKQQNPGKVDTVVPLTMTYDPEFVAGPLIEPFLANATEQERFLYDHTNTATRVFTPGAKDAYKLLNKMYNEGLISPDFALDRDSTKADSDMARGLAGSTMGNYDFPLRSNPGLLDQLLVNVPTAELVPVDCFTDANGKHTKSLYEAHGIKCIIPAASKDRAEQAVAYLDWMVRPEILKYLQLGEEGKHYKMEDGVPVMLTVEDNTKMNTSNNIDYTLLANGVYQEDPALMAKAASRAFPGYEQLFLDCYDVSMNDGYFRTTIPMPIEKDSEYQNAIKEKSYEVLAKVIVADPAKFDQAWDQALQDLLETGMQECIDERQAAWDQLN